MTFRCPYCRRTFGEAPANRCPGCGKAILMPGFFASKKRDPQADGEAGQAGILPPRRASRRPGPFALLGNNGAKMAIVLVLMMVVGVGLVSRVKAPPPDSNARKIDRARLSLANLRVALDIYRYDLGNYPASDEGLASLIHPPVPKPGWWGPYIYELKNDLWGVPFQYRLEGSNVVLFACGPDRLPDTADDIRINRSDVLLEREKGTIHAVVLFTDGTRKIIREKVTLDETIPAELAPEQANDVKN
jgi:general secretion pathway protein G